MPTIKTKLQLEGGKDFRDQIAANGRELRLFGSELDKADAQFQNNSKSVEALTRKNEILDRTLVAQKEKVALLKAELDKANTTYGESDKRTQRLAEQLNKAETAAIKTENAIKNNKDQMENMNTTTLKASDFVNQLAGKFGISLPEGVGKSIDKMISMDGATATMIGGIAAAIAIVVKLEDELIKLTEKQGKAADELQTQGMKFGIDPETIQEWRYAAKFIDTSEDTMFSSITKLTRSMGDAKSGNKELQASFKDLGVEYQDHNGNLRDTKQVFFEVIDALGKKKSAADRDVATMQLMGRSAMDLNPLIAVGSAGLKRYADEAHDLGLIAKNDTVTALGLVDDSVERMNARMNAGNNLIAERFGPTTVKFNDQLGDLMLTGTELLVDSGFLDILSAILDVVSGTFPLVEATWKLLAPVAQTTLKPIALGLAVIADALTVIANVLALIIECVRWLINFGQGSYNFVKYGNNATNAVINGATANLIRNYATGTDFHPGGPAVVGEEGWEIVDLPRGSRVIPHKQSVQMLRGRVPAYAGGVGSFGGNNYYITIDAKNVREFNDMVRIAETKRVSMRQGTTRRG